VLTVRDAVRFENESRPLTPSVRSTMIASYWLSTTSTYAAGFFFSYFFMQYKDPP